MKRLITLLSILLCAVGFAQNPKEIQEPDLTIGLGESYTWTTQFAAGSDVDFDTLDDNDDDVLDLDDDDNKCVLKGIHLGTTKVLAVFGDTVYYRNVTVVAKSSGKPSGEEEEVGPAFTGTYKYNPPKDHYYIRDAYDFIYARIGNILMEKDLESDGQLSYWMCYDLAANEAHQYLEDGGFDHLHTDAEELEASQWDGLRNLKLLGTFAESDFLTIDEPDLADYYLGNETVLGVSCWVFDSPDYKYWVDPSNGCCLKYAQYKYDTDGKKTISRVSEVKVYDLKYYMWSDDMKDSTLKL